MLTKEKIPEKLGKVADTVEDDFSHDFGDNSISEEPEMTGALAALLNSGFRKQSVDGDIEVRSKAYRSREEKESGPDLGIRFRFVTESFATQTAVLIQAKRSENHDVGLPLQCYKMLSRTTDAYIFRYSKSGITAIPALPVYFDQGTGGKFTKYYQMSFGDFFKRFFEGFIGEMQIARNIDKPSEASLVDERAKFIVDVVVYSSQSEDVEQLRFNNDIDRDYYRIMDR